MGDRLGVALALGEAETLDVCDSLDDAVVLRVPLELGVPLALALCDCDVDCEGDWLCDAVREKDAVADALEVCDWELEADSLGVAL